MVFDATNLRFAGIGAGLASFLQASLERTQCAVIPVLFSSKTKSDLGWNLVGAIETGRFQDYDRSEGEAQEPGTRPFWHEVETCQYEVPPRPPPAPIPSTRSTKAARKPPAAGKNKGARLRRIALAVPARQCRPLGTAGLGHLTIPYRLI